MGRLPTEQEVLNLSNLQIDALEYACRSLEKERWDTLRRILGTKWTYEDLHGMPADTPDAPAQSEIVMPLGCIIQPNLMQSLRKVPLIPSTDRAPSDMIEGSQLNREEFKELFDGVDDVLAEISKEDDLGNVFGHQEVPPDEKE
jgi:hypothetical protein